MPSLLQRFAWLFLPPYLKLFRSLEIHGIENLKNVRSNSIIASNHVSELDPLALVACLPFFSRHLPLIFTSRERSFYKKNWKQRLYGGRFFTLMGAYPVYPGLDDYGKSLRLHIQALNSGKNVCIFPVGKIHSLEQSTEARGGVSFLSHTTHTPIVPVLIQQIPTKNKLVITFGKPIEPSSPHGEIEQNTTKDGAINRATHEKAARALMNKIAHLK